MISNKCIELEALKTECEGMKAENLYDLSKGHGLSFDRQKFQELAERMRMLKEPTAELPKLSVKPGEIEVYVLRCDRCGEIAEPGRLSQTICGLFKDGDNCPGVIRVGNL